MWEWNIIHHEITIPTDLINKMEKREREREWEVQYIYSTYMLHHKYVHKYTTEYTTRYNDVSI